ncbi:MAG: 30S ribosomal protein S6e [bacterium]|nr:30S ribosomal protein S6e [bacterium]
MAELRFVINDTKTGKTYQKALEDESLVGKKIGETVRGDFLGLEGYELQIRGGSDFAGFPMRNDIEGPIRKKALLGSGVGVKIDRKGMKKRKTVCGNQVTVKTAQLNLSVKKYGQKPLDDIFGKKEDAKAE